MDSNKKHKIISAVLGAVVLLIIALMIWQTNKPADKPTPKDTPKEQAEIHNDQPPKEGFIRVPDVVKKDQKDAQAILKKVGLASKVVPVPAPGFKANTVTKQIPAKGADVPKKAVVTLFVAANDAKNAQVGQVMPNLVGKTVAQAQALMPNTNLQITYVYNPDKPLNQIIDQMPAKGQIVTPNFPVQVMVNKKVGSNLISHVPNVVGMTATKAKATLAKQGYQAQLSYSPQNNSGIKAGEVVMQSPPAGVLLPTSQKVQLIIYRPVKPKASK